MYIFVNIPMFILFHVKIVLTHKWNGLSYYNPTLAKCTKIFVGLQ